MGVRAAQIAFAVSTEGEENASDAPPVIFVSAAAGTAAYILLTLEGVGVW